MEHRDKTFENQEILLDGNVFTGCTFRNCRIVVRGEAGAIVGACTFENAKWVLKGPAASTLQFLSQLYKASQSGPPDRRGFLL